MVISGKMLKITRLAANSIQKMEYSICNLDCRIFFYHVSGCNKRTADQGDPKHQRNHFLSSSSVLFSITVLFLKFCITRIDSSIFTIYMMERDQFR